MRRISLPGGERVSVEARCPGCGSISRRMLPQQQDAILGGPVTGGVLVVVRCGRCEVPAEPEARPKPSPPITEKAVQEAAQRLDREAAGDAMRARLGTGPALVVGAGNRLEGAGEVLPGTVADRPAPSIRSFPSLNTARDAVELDVLMRVHREADTREWRMAKGGRPTRGTGWTGVGCPDGSADGPVRRRRAGFDMERAGAASADLLRVVRGADGVLGRGVRRGGGPDPWRGC